MAIQFIPHPEIGCSPSVFNASPPGTYKTHYKYDYAKFFRAVACGDIPYEQTQAYYRKFILDDLFFVVCFVMQIERANHPFVVKMCQMVENGPRTNTLDVWARGHFKSVVITQAETLQYHLRNPEHCTGIMAYARPLAKAFLRSIKITCETSDLLKWCFPDILWEKPETMAPKWSEDDGLIFKRKSSSRKESTIEAWGLVEGQPTGRHFERVVFDDVETDDIKDSPDMLDKVYSKFEMAGNLGTMSDTDTVRVIGTYYSHFGPIVRIENMVKLNADGSDGDPIYTTRKVTGSEDGTRDGTPVLVGQETWEKLKTGQHFQSQQLCNPTPAGETKLNPAYLKPIDPEDIPKDAYLFMVLDQAGGSDTNTRKGDLWACTLIAVKPQMDEIGTSNIYIKKIKADQMSHSEGIETVVRMYIESGLVRQLGVEKVGLSTTEVHITNALKAHGRRLSVENGNLFLLKPAGRSLASRIEGALAWPLNNGKVHYSTDIDTKTIERMKNELVKFPHFHSDIINTVAYLYDMLATYKFSKAGPKKSIDYTNIYLR